MAYEICFSEIILYVDNQDVSTLFYQQILRMKPSLNEPGMTEFTISDGIKLGLMPTNGIAKILGNTMMHPDKGKDIPRCELYFNVDDIELEFENALICGAKLVSSIEERNWGDKVCYFADPDGHIIAFAKKINKNTQ